MVYRIYLAINVLPVPGGPYIKHPLGGLTPTLLNNSGLVMGSSMVSLSTLNCSLSPPISSNPTYPGSSFIMLNTIGSTSLGNILTNVNVS